MCVVDRPAAARSPLAFSARSRFVWETQKPTAPRIPDTHRKPRQNGVNDFRGSRASGSSWWPSIPGGTSGGRGEGGGMGGPPPPPAAIRATLSTGVAGPPGPFYGLPVEGLWPAWTNGPPETPRWGSGGGGRARGLVHRSPLPTRPFPLICWSRGCGSAAFEKAEAQVWQGARYRGCRPPRRQGDPVHGPPGSTPIPTLRVYSGLPI